MHKATDRIDNSIGHLSHDKATVEVEARAAEATLGVLVDAEGMRSPACDDCLALAHGYSNGVEQSGASDEQGGLAAIGLVFPETS